MPLRVGIGMPTYGKFGCTETIRTRRLAVYARVTTVPVQPGKIGEAIKLIQDSVAPVLQQQAGFKGWHLLTDVAKNKIMSITLWQTEADLKEGQFSPAYQEQIAKLSSLAAGPPAVEQYEVSHTLLTD